METWRWFERAIAPIAVIALVGCGDGSGPSASSPESSTTPDATEAPAPAQLVEQAVRFDADGDELYGILTLPAGRPSPPVVVLVSGSGDTEGIRDHSGTPLLVDHAHALAAEGVATLRYDPPGVGRSSGERGLPSLERRVEELMAAVRHVASIPEVDGSTVGLLGWSQGPWVMASAAARHPDEIAFLISVVGSGQTVAAQQIYGFEAQTRAAGLPEEDVAKAVLVGRLLIDWQLIDPIHREANEVALDDLGDGPWAEFADLVYRRDDLDPIERLPLVIEVLRSVQDEPWAAALYLRELMVPQLESIPTDITLDELALVRAQTDANLRTDPADFLTEVTVPVLAIFGEHDINVDSTTSAARYKQYLAEAGNDDVTIVVLPDVGHDISVDTPGYWELVSDWLERHPPT